MEDRRKAPDHSVRGVEEYLRHKSLVHIHGLDSGRGLSEKMGDTIWLYTYSSNQINGIRYRQALWGAIDLTGKSKLYGWLHVNDNGNFNRSLKN